MLGLIESLGDEIVDVDDGKICLLGVYNNFTYFALSAFKRTELLTKIQQPSCMFFFNVFCLFCIHSVG